MSALGFLSPSACAPGSTVSPLRRALEGVDPALVEDRSLDGKVELRGAVSGVAAADGETLVRLSPRRAFLLSEEPDASVERLRAAGHLAYDVTGGFAGLAVHGEALMRRLTDLDLAALPAAGPILGVPAIVLRGDGGRFRLYVPQELGHDLAIAVLDAIAGLEETRA